MIADFRRAMGVIVVREQGNSIVIEGLPSFDIARDVSSTWGTSRINTHMFSSMTRSKIVFGKFFAIDVLFMLQQLVESRGARTPKRILQKMVHELTLNTWLKDINFDERHTRLNFSKVNAVTFKLLPHQLEFLQRYNRVVPSYRLNGMLLAAPPGSGKTITDLVLSACLEADVCIIISPKNAIERVWEATIENNLTTHPKYWISKVSGEPAPAGKTHYVFHYEALDRALELAKTLRNKNVFIALDECHNFNEITSQRTEMFVELCKITRCQNVLWASGTPIKSIGAECIPLLRTIDPFFDKDAEERFRKIFGRDARRANDILRNRIGLVSFKVEKTTIVDTKVYPAPVNIHIPNAETYTLEAIRTEMRSFIDERRAFYKGHMKDFQTEYDRCLEIHADTLYSKSDKEGFELYKRYIKTIRQGYDPVSMKAETMYCNKYELKDILPTLPEHMRKSFKSIRSIIKYVELKIMGEALARVLGKKRVACNVEMVPHVPFKRLIDEALKKTIIFTNYVEVLKAVEEKLRAEGYTPIVVYGETNRDLGRMIDRFHKDDSVNPAIATFKSLSTAVPIVVANNMIMMDSPFRDHERDQAISRCARIGQDQDVFVWDVFLDTGSKANISTRSKDILQWSKEQVEQIMGIDAPTDLEATLENMVDSDVELDFSGLKFISALTELHEQAKGEEGGLVIEDPYVDQDA